MFEQGLVRVTGFVTVRAGVYKGVLKVFALNMVPHVRPGLVTKGRVHLNLLIGVGRVGASQ